MKGKSSDQQVLLLHSFYIMNISMQDPFTGKYNTVDLPITASQLHRWLKGELIQNVMPNLNDDQREFLISGIPPGKFEEYMGPERED